MKKIIVLFWMAVISPIVLYAQDLSGSWKGDLNVMGQQLPLIFHFVADGEGWKGTMDSPNQGAKGLALSKVLFEDSMLSLEMSAGGINYEGIVLGNTIKGTFTQGGMSLPLDLQKLEVGEAEMVIKRPQLPKGPYEYEIEETLFTNLNDQITLKGTVTKPIGNGPFAAVVLVTGSGPQDRNSEIFGHKPFLVISDYLTRKGIVVLRYDERGVGESEGDFSSATSIDFKNDAQTAIEHLKKFSFVDQTKVGVIGHSEGGLISWMLGAEKRNLDFLVALAAPVVPIPELMIKQTEEVAKSMGLSEAIVQQQVAFNTLFYTMVQNIDSIEEGKIALPELIEHHLLALELNEDQKEQQKEALLKAYMPHINPWFMNFINANPEDYIQEIRIPLFAAFGEKDIQVNASQNANRLQELFTGRRRSLLEFQVYPQLNHLFQTAKTGSVAEYGQIEETFNENVMQDVAAFILSQ